MKSELDEGYARARALTRDHGKSFYFASMALSAERKRGAFALYAFMRRLDDLIDENVSDTEKGDRLARARRVVERLFHGGQRPEDEPFDASELAALQDTIARFGLEEQPFIDMLDGMQMDVANFRYETQDDVDLYCYRVAGTVGLLIAPIFGARDRVARTPACALGHAMQLTNILRDVAEDFQRHRVYLAAGDLKASGGTVTDIADQRMSEGLVRVYVSYAARARTLYREALAGVHYIDGFFSRVCVRMMAAIYGDILRVIEARGPTFFGGRAVVSKWRKIRLALRAFFDEVGT
jgi:15-cis-phytoene synthase